MNRIEFIGRAHQGNYLSTDDIENFFDHMMVAYEVVESANNISIDRISENSYSAFKINISSPDQSELVGIDSYIKNELHNRKNVYDKSFNIDSFLENSILHMIVRNV